MWDSQENHTLSKANVTKSVCLSIGQADGENESIQLEKEARTYEFENPVHVGARNSHSKNSDFLMKHLPNVSESNLQVKTNVTADDLIRNRMEGRANDDSIAKKSSNGWVGLIEERTEAMRR